VAASGTTPVAQKAAAKPAAGPAWGGVREEAMMLIALLSCVAAMAWTRLPNHLESAMWMTILVLQAVPYAASLICAGLSALPEFRTRSRPRPSFQAAAASAGPGVLATVRAMTGVDKGRGGGTPSNA
jgi:hypothetical protein